MTEPEAERTGLRGAAGRRGGDRDRAHRRPPWAAAGPDRGGRLRGARGGPGGQAPRPLVALPDGLGPDHRRRGDGDRGLVARLPDPGGRRPADDRRPQRQDRRDRHRRAADDPHRRLRQARRHPRRSRSLRHDDAAAGRPREGRALALLAAPRPQGRHRRRQLRRPPSSTRPTPTAASRRRCRRSRT